MKRTKPPARKGGLKRSAMKPHRAKDQPGKGDAAGYFREVVCGARDSTLEAHHCLPRKWLVGHATRQGLKGPAFWAVVYDPRIAIALSPEEHRLHTQRLAVIPGAVLPVRVWDAAAAYGPEAIEALKREHPAPPAVRCSADPWSDWCRRGTPNTGAPQGDGPVVCAPCRADGCTAREDA